jgi:maspardin
VEQIMGCVRGRPRQNRTIEINQPYLLDPDKAADRLTQFHSVYKERMCSAGGQRWRYRRTGISARPLFMLPGIQGGGSVFFDLALELGDKLDLVMVTAPPIVDAIAMADAQAALLDALGFRQIDLFGSSLGGYLAQAFAIRHPDRLRKILLANTFADPGPFLAKAPSPAGVGAQPAGQVMAQNLALMLGAPAIDAGQVALQSVMRALVGPVQTADEYKARLMTLLEAVAIQRVPIADDRIVLIDDDADPGIPSSMRTYIRERYRSAPHYMIAGGGHLPAIQRPNSVASILRDHLCNG